jgi:hypothetical protein
MGKTERRADLYRYHQGPERGRHAGCIGARPIFASCRFGRFDEPPRWSFLWSVTSCGCRVLYPIPSLWPAPLTGGCVEGMITFPTASVVFADFGGIGVSMVRLFHYLCNPHIAEHLPPLSWPVLPLLHHQSNRLHRPKYFQRGKRLDDDRSGGKFSSCFRTCVFLSQRSQNPVTFFHSHFCTSLHFRYKTVWVSISPTVWSRALWLPLHFRHCSPVCLGDVVLKDTTHFFLDYRYDRSGIFPTGRFPSRHSRRVFPASHPRRLHWRSRRFPSTYRVSEGRASRFWVSPPRTFFTL